MNRRTFFRNGAMGAVGLSLPALPGAAFTLFQPENVGHWMRQMVKASGLRRGSLQTGDAGLLQQLSAIETQLAQRDYYRESDQVYYFSGTEDLFFYPLWLRRSAVGLTDLVLPVLARQPDGSWQTVITLTGYQLEALARAAAALSGTGMPLAELLLPVRRMQTGGGIFESRRGRVQILTRLEQGVATTAITVRESQQTVFEASFPSRHGLTAKALTA